MISEEIRDMLSSSDEEMIQLGLTFCEARRISSTEIFEIFGEINKYGYLYAIPSTKELKYISYSSYQRDFTIRTGLGGMNLLNKFLKDI
jgi:hypothetical protein